MPLIVNREEEKRKILMAFEECLSTKPIFNISLRDIAAKAGMTHPKILCYFDSRDDLIREYCRYVKDYMYTHCERWFESHNPAIYESKKAYLNAFLEYCAKGEDGETRPTATVQTYVLAKYDGAINRMIKEEFSEWKALMKRCLVSVFGDGVADDDAEFMMILISGIFICHYNGVLSPCYGDDMLSSLAFLKKELTISCVPVF